MLRAVTESTSLILTDVKHQTSVRFKVFQTVLDHFLQYDDLQLLIVVYRDVAKAHHRLHTVGERPFDQSFGGQNVEGAAGILGNAETVNGNHVHGHVDRRLAGALPVPSTWARNTADARDLADRPRPASSRCSRLQK